MNNLNELIGKSVKLKSSGQVVTLVSISGPVARVSERIFSWIVPTYDIVSVDTDVILEHKPRAISFEEYELKQSQIKPEEIPDLTDEDIFFGLEDEDDFVNEEAFYEPEFCQPCVDESEENGVEYEANFYLRDGCWYCSNCNRQV